MLLLWQTAETLDASSRLWKQFDHPFDSVFLAASMQQISFGASRSSAAVCCLISEMRGTLSWRTAWVIYGCWKRSRWLVHQDSACQMGINKLHQLYCMWMKYWNETNKQAHKSATQIYTAVWTITLTADVFVSWEPSELIEGAAGAMVEVHVSCSFCFRPPFVLHIISISYSVSLLCSTRSLQRQQQVVFSSLWAPPQRFLREIHGYPRHTGVSHATYKAPVILFGTQNAQRHPAASDLPKSALYHLSYSVFVRSPSALL